MNRLFFLVLIVFVGYLYRGPLGIAEWLNKNLGVPLPDDYVPVTEPDGPEPEPQPQPIENGKEPETLPPPTRRPATLEIDFTSLSQSPDSPYISKRKDLLIPLNWNREYGYVSALYERTPIALDPQPGSYAALTYENMFNPGFPKSFDQNPSIYRSGTGRHELPLLAYKPNGYQPFVNHILQQLNNLSGITEYPQFRNANLRDILAYPDPSQSQHILTVLSTISQMESLVLLAEGALRWLEVFINELLTGDDRLSYRPQSYGTVDTGLRSPIRSGTMRGPFRIFLRPFTTLWMTGYVGSSEYVRSLIFHDILSEGDRIYDRLDGLLQTYFDITFQEFIQAFLVGPVFAGLYAVRETADVDPYQFRRLCYPSFPPQEASGLTNYEPGTIISLDADGFPARQSTMRDFL